VADLRLDVAAPGVERAFEESGEIARVIVRPRGDQPITVKLVEADLRDINNERDVIEETGGGDTFVPTVSTLHQNRPNPFNPTTTIELRLPDDGQHDAGGRVASGVYFAVARTKDALYTTKLILIE
jgi:hypothetical protein